MKTKTLILAIFSLLALANAQQPKAKAYADPEESNPVYAYPGYQQPAYKYVQFKLNYSGISCSILFA